MARVKTQLETVAEVTERAARAAHNMIPPTVFVPLDLRRSKRRLVKDRVTAAPATEAEVQDRIAAAAPHEFLIAVMNGQPIPAFEITEKQGQLDIAVTYMLPTMQDRLNAAGHLTTYKSPASRKTGDVSFDAAINNAAANVEDEE